MEPPNVLTELVGQFASAAAHEEGPALVARECRLRQTLKEHGLAPPRLVEPHTDTVLVQALQKSFFFDEVYDELFARYETVILWYLVDRCGVEYHRAAELVQELFLIIATTRLHKFDPEKGKLKAYLLRAAYNRWVSEDLRPVQPTFEAMPQELPAPGSDPVDIAAAREMETLVREKLAELPENQRRVLELVLDGHNHETIAGMLGISRDTVYRLVFQARQALAALMGITLPPTPRGRPRRSPPPDANR